MNGRGGFGLSHVFLRRCEKKSCILLTLLSLLSPVLNYQCSQIGGTAATGGTAIRLRDVRAGDRVMRLVRCLPR